MKKQLTLALDPGTLDALRARARQEHRSVSNLIQHWMSEAVSGSGSPAPSPNSNPGHPPRPEASPASGPAPRPRGA